MRLHLLVLVLLTIGNTAAFAADATAPKGASARAIAVAGDHFDIGTKAYNDGKYPLAREEFDIAYKLSGEPDLLYNIALCYEREGELRKALDYFTRYSDARPDVAEVRAKIERMRAELGVSAPPQPQPQASSTPPAKPPDTAPQVSLVVPATPPPTRRLTKKRIAGITLLSLAGASLVASIALGAVTQRDRSALNNGELTYPQAVEAADRAEATRGASIGFGVFAGVSIAAGLPLLLLPEK